MFFPKGRYARTRGYREGIDRGSLDLKLGRNGSAVCGVNDTVRRRLRFTRRECGRVWMVVPSAV